MTARPTPPLRGRSRRQRLLYAMRLYFHDARNIARDLHLRPAEVRAMLVEARLLPEVREHRERIVAHVRRVASARRSGVRVRVR